MQKCDFGATEKLFVSFKVNLCRIHMVNRQIVIINDWPIQVSTPQLRPFLVLTGYYWKFVYNFMYWTKTLYTVKANRGTISCVMKHQVPFNDIRRAFMSAPVLELHDSEYDYILRTDGSEVVIGSIMAETKDCRQEGQLVDHPMDFFS